MRRLVLAALIACASLGIARASGITNVLLGAGGYAIASVTLTAGQGQVTGPPAVAGVGYCNVAIANCPGGATYGTLSSTALGSQTIAIIEGLLEGSTYTALVEVCGFSAEPPITWLGRVTFNAITYTGSQGSQSYTSGCTTWSWAAAGIWMTSGTAYPGTIQYP